MNKAFCERLRECRKAKALTQEEIAKAIGITQSAYAHWELGRNEPDTAALKKLANILDTSTDYLIGRINIVS